MCLHGNDGSSLRHIALRSVILFFSLIGSVVAARALAYCSSSFHTRFAVGWNERSLSCKTKARMWLSKDFHSTCQLRM